MGQMHLHTAYELLRDAISHGEHEKVASLAIHVLHFFPNNIRAKLYLGEAHIALNNFAEALSMFEDVYKSDPENIVALIGLSTVAERNGDIGVATEYLERAMEIRPDMGQLRPRLLNLYQRSARHDVYLHLSRIGLARLFMRSNAFSQAIPEFQQEVSSNPNRHENVIALAEAFWRNGDFEEAYNVCSQIIDKHPYLLKINVILALFHMKHDASKSEYYWQQVQIYDPMYETAKELAAGIEVRETVDWQLPEWDNSLWYVKHINAKASSGVRIRFLNTNQIPTIPNGDTEHVINQFRQLPMLRESEHDSDCVCMPEDNKSHDSTGALMQRTIDRQSEFVNSAEACIQNHEQDVPVLAVEHPVATEALQEKDVTNSSHSSERRITLPVEPEHDEIVTEPVHKQHSMTSNPQIHHQFLSTLMDDAHADSQPVVSGLADTSTIAQSNREVEDIQTLKSCDDLIVVLARYEMRHATSRTEDLRDVLARTLGSRFVAKTSSSAVDDELSATISNHISQDAPGNIDSISMNSISSGQQNDNLLVSLLAKPGSGLTEGMRGLSAALPRASAPRTESETQLNDDLQDDSMTELLSQGMRVGHVDETDVARASGGDKTTQDALMAMLEDESVIVNQTPAAGIKMPQSQPMHEFPMTGAHTVVDVSQVVFDLGLTSGELREVASEMPVTPVTNTAVATHSKGEEKRATTSTAVAEPAPSVVPDNMAMEGYLRALQDDPENAILRLSVARVAIQCRMYETALIHYRHLIRNSSLLEEITHDLHDILADVGEPQLRRDCSRLLGNAYARQSKVQEAVEAYRMTLNSGSVPLM